MDRGMEMSCNMFVWINIWEGGEGGGGRPSGAGGRDQVIGDNEPDHVPDKVNGRA